MDSRCLAQLNIKRPKDFIVKKSQVDLLKTIQNSESSKLTWEQKHIDKERSTVEQQIQTCRCMLTTSPLYRGTNRCIIPVVIIAHQRVRVETTFPRVLC